PSPADKAAIPFNYFAETANAGDTLGAKTPIAATGITTVTANDNTMYVIELDASELSDGFEWVEVEINIASGNSCLVSGVVILSGSRYAEDQNATAIV
ncbi:MAG TPA: hypothetical protein VMW31_04630, partial [Devosiaceae bacterium]|nr:hypothetical protein [Devosiaceae bacterium]